MVDKKKNGGYGPSNPEPQEFRDSAVTSDEPNDALHASLEYINGEKASDDSARPQLPCKNSLPT